MAVDFGALLETVGNISDAAVAAGDLANSLPWTRPAYQQFCRIMAGTGVPQALASVDVPSICQPYLDEDGRDFGGDRVPFTGGQCQVAYRVNATSFVKRNGVVTANQTIQHNSVAGPISRETLNTSQQKSIFLKNRFGTIFQQASAGGITPGEQVEVSLTVNSIVRIDGLADNCGDPPGEYQPGTGYDGEDYGQPFDYVDGNGRQWNINLQEPLVTIDGSIEIPVTVDGVEFNIGGRSSEAPPAGPSVDGGKPDYDNPSDPVRPGDPGQPSDGVNYSGPVACAIVVVTQENAERSIEVGGQENIFIPGYNSDAGWYRFRKLTGTTQPVRLLGRSTITCYCCSGNEYADGFQVKFSYGYDGYVVIIPPKPME